jgi:hypothetical protein
MIICMRTTLIIDDELMRRVKHHAVSSGQTLTRTVEAALSALVAGTPAPRSRYRLRWHPVKGRMLPGIDIADRDSLYERMDGRS